MQKFLKIALILILAIFFGCKSKQIVTKKPVSMPQNEINSAENIVNQIVKSQNELSFVNISNAEMILNVEGKSFSLRCNLKIIKNQEITLSILPILGIEMFRFHLKPNNFYIFDKLNRQYCENNYEYLNNILGVEISYQTIENLLTNRLFTLSQPGTENDLSKTFSVLQMPDKYILTENKRTGIFTHFFDILPDFVISATSLNENSNEVLSVKYSDFYIQNGALFPMKIDINSNFKTKKMTANIEIKKMEINKKFNITPIDISRYKKVICNNIIP
jgi:hypothetical protein